jgi:cysteine-rich repeat protein
LFGDGCRGDCLGFEVCGDGLLDADSEETCDDGNTSAGDGCNDICIVEFCGDGLINVDAAQGTVDACDDGNNTDGDGCSSLCQIE